MADGEGGVPGAVTYRDLAALERAVSERFERQGNQIGQLEAGSRNQDRRMEEMAMRVGDVGDRVDRMGERMTRTAEERHASLRAEIQSMVAASDKATKESVASGLQGMKEIQDAERQSLQAEVKALHAAQATQAESQRDNNRNVVILMIVVAALLGALLGVEGIGMLATK